MKKMMLANAKQLSKNEMKQVMAGLRSSDGQCGSGCSGSCQLQCGGKLQRGNCQASTGGTCYCTGAC